MPVEIKIPSVGESITQVVVSHWIKETGAFVKKDEPIVELETDKINQELVAPETGILKIDVNEGETVGIGTVIGSIEPGVENAGKAPGPATPPDAKPDAKPAPTAPAAAPAAVAAPADEHKASPLARKVAADRGVNLDAVTGSGPGGRIVKEDVLASVAPEKPAAAPAAPAAPAKAPAPASTPAPTGDRAVTRERMSQLRKRIAARLVEAQHTAAMLTTFNEVDMTAVMEARAKYKEGFAKKHGVGLGFMSFFVKATLEGLKEFPRLNAFIEGDEFVYHHYHDIGVAVGTDRGLVVPVLRNVEKMSFADIEKGIRDYAEKAKNGKLTIDDLSGGTFTISNGGVYGSMMSTPILNPPQSGILGMHNIIKRPIAVGDKVEIRPMMYIAMSYDHRIVDGKEAVGFLVRIKQCIESPERMLFEV